MITVSAAAATAAAAALPHLGAWLCNVHSDLAALEVLSIHLRAGVVGIPGIFVGYKAEAAGLAGLLVLRKVDVFNVTKFAKGAAHELVITRKGKAPYENLAPISVVTAAHNNGGMSME